MSGWRGTRWSALLLIFVVALVFATDNAGERVVVDLGVATFYRVPLVPLIFLAFLLGMTTMFLLGLRHDLRVRDALREAGFGEPVGVGEAPGRWRPAAGAAPPETEQTLEMPAVSAAEEESTVETKSPARPADY